SCPIVHAVTPSALGDEAVAANPEINFYAAEIAAARAGRKTAGQIANPNLSVEAGRMTTGESGDGPVWRAQISQTFDFPARVALRKAVADRDIALADLGLVQFKSLLRNEVRARAGELILLRKKMEAVKSVRSRLADVVGVLVQRDTGNVSAKLERRILESSVLTMDREISNALTDAEAMRVDLNALCGRAPSALLDIEDDAVAFPSIPSLETLKSQAAETNFDLQQKRVELARQGLKIDLSKADRWGSVSFGPYLGGQKAGDSEKEVGIVFSIPLPLWDKNKGAIDEAAARAEQGQALLNATLRDLERDLTKARDAYARELDTLDLWKNDPEAAFKEAAEEADRHYRLGAVPVTTYVEMQRQYLAAIDALVETRQHAWEHLMVLERLLGGKLGAKGGAK
ncbi:MAG: TolC family protein, partial [Verrucomicrobiales bacterium]|nr:TolC family protein [Verrucomicrobiales bacterium]